MRGIALAEQDQRRAIRAVAAFQLARNAGQVGQREFPVHRRRQHAAPGVEHLQRLRTGRALRGQIGNHRVGVHRQQFVQSGRIIQRHRLDPRVILAAAAFDHVAGQRPRTAGKADQRHLAVQFAPDQAHRVHHVAQLGFHVRYRQPVRVGGGAHGAFELRAFALDEVQAQTHCVGHGEDVGEQDRSVQPEAAQRLQGHLAGDLRVLGHAQEAAGGGARGAVLRQVAAGLAHQPDGRAVDGFALEGAQQAIVLQWTGHRVPCGESGRAAAGWGKSAARVERASRSGGAESGRRGSAHGCGAPCVKVIW